MTPERWREVTQIYGAVVSRAPEQRAAAITELCAGDAELRREIESLLESHHGTSLLDRPASDRESVMRMVLPTGSQIGVFRIDALLGVGGMGEVYRARDTKLNRDVAIKILPPAFAGDSDRLARFKREAQLLASLNHPNIAAIYGFEDSAAVHALVLELVEGPTLADRIAPGPLPIDEALKVAKQIAEALEAAHEQGIIHRDLKPANIKVRDDDAVKVLDFGLAKALEPTAAMPASPSMSPTVTSPALTQAGMILGTAAYMSPEQARGKPIDKRADIWAFGCVLFEMLTGERAFPGEDVTDTLAAVVRAEPDWSLLPGNLPPLPLVFLKRSLQKDPKHRLGDIRDVRLALEGAFDVAPEAPAAPAISARQALWRRSLPAVTFAIVVGVLAGAAGWELQPSPPQQTVTRFTHRLLPGQFFTNAGRQVVAISPDGTQILYAAAQRLYLRALSETEARPIPGVDIALGGGANPVFSPDGRSIAFRDGSEGTLKRIDVRGGAAVTLCPIDIPFGMSWGADGILFGQSAKGIMRVAANGGQPELLVGVNSGELAHGPQMLPGGQAVLFTVATGFDADRWDKAHIVVQTLKSGERKTLIEGSDARYLPTGHLVYAHGGSLFAVAFDLRRLEVTGGPVPVVEGISRGNGSTGTAQFSVSSGGVLVYIPGPVSTSLAKLNLVLVDRKGAIQTLKLPPAAYSHPRVSPDGEHVVYTIDDAKESNVWTYDLSETIAPRKLTFGGRNEFPIWSSDGEHVAFQSDHAGDLGIFWQRVDGTDQASQLTKPEMGASHAPESWAPDGSGFLFRVVRRESVTLWMFPMKDKKAVPFDDVRSVSALTNSIFSPDGHWVAYTVGGGATQEGNGIYVQPFPPTGEKHQIALGPGIHPLWSPNSKELLYGLPGGPVAVSVTSAPTFAVGNPVQVMARGLFGGVGPDSPRRYDMMPNGSLLGEIQPSQPSSDASTSPEIQVVLNWFEELKARVPTK
jgi:serine/threonine-protein kinase